MRGPFLGHPDQQKKAVCGSLRRLIQVNLMRPLGSVSSTLLARTVDLSSDRVIGLLFWHCCSRKLLSFGSWVGRRA